MRPKIQHFNKLPEAGVGTVLSRRDVGLCFNESLLLSPESRGWIFNRPFPIFPCRHCFLIHHQHRPLAYLLVSQHRTALVGASGASDRAEDGNAKCMPSLPTLTQPRWGRPCVLCPGQVTSGSTPMVVGSSRTVPTPPRELLKSH